jgi:hypothetical protein
MRVRHLLPVVLFFAIALVAVRSAGSLTPRIQEAIATMKAG